MFLKLKSIVRKTLNSILVLFLALFKQEARPEDVLKVPVYEPQKQSNPHWIEDMYRTMSLAPIGSQREHHVDWTLRVIDSNKHHYMEAQRSLDQLGAYVPWEVIAAIHILEASGDISKQILNGQDFKMVTTKVPRNRGPWSTWHESAVDALINRGLPEEWSVATMLDFIERWNGLGYRNRGMNSPYLWAYTNHQQHGKFVSDGKFDKDYISLQVGAALILRGLGI